ncbi:T9SS-dependent choice-of-anchor J family protein [Aestuariivivens sediminicola]|uniref:T9SS-dependent choice-of-anchor J family protein n=1 Tax=Aestuariivivens sediminicola TaxID=2913560 RepID=UPI001F5736BA|nr:choice-of-anchor J domain-containing protein [Aestuariivivens sediminicola]
MMKKILLSLGFVVYGIYGLHAQCDSTLPVSEDFSNTFAVNSCWTYIDADGDGLGWSVTAMDGSGNKGLKSKSFAGTALTPDNWIISNAINLPSSGSLTLTWKVRATYWQYDAENYSVYVANGNSISDFTSSSVVFTENLEGSDASGVFANRNLNVSSLAGQTVYVAFRHYGVTDQFEIDIDDFAVTDGGSNGGPTCNQQSKNFPVSDNTLSYSGSGTGETAITLPADSQDISFTISGLNSKTKGKGSTQFIDMVDVTYNNTTFTYSGSNISSKTFNISGPSDGISIRLYNGLSGSNQTLSVTLSDVTYCSDSNPPPCVDANNNGICDVDEPSGDCAPKSKPFGNGTLSGTNSTTLSFETNSQDVSFTISNIGDKQKGKPTGHYIEEVQVTYNNGIDYGTFRGDQVSSVFVEILGNVSNVRIALRDALGNTSSISVNLSEVAYCVSGTSAKSVSSKSMVSSIETPLSEERVKIYPNPASDVLHIKYGSSDTLKNVKLYNLTGALILNKFITNSFDASYSLDISDISGGMYLLQLSDENDRVIQTKRLVIK